MKQRVSREQILAVLGATQGNVSAAARALGMHRNNLYKRLIAMGLQPDSVRTSVGTVAEAAHAAPPATPAPTATGWQSGAVTGPRRARAPSGGSRAHDSGAAILRHPGGPATFPDVNTEEATGRKLRATKSLFLRPEQIEALEGATFDLSFKFRERFSPSKVLERFIDERFADWLRETMGESRRRGQKGGSE